jgi:hypothetical protein
MLDKASDAWDAVSLNSKPLLPPTGSDAADRDAAEGADVAAALLVSTQEDVEHPSCRSWQDEEHQYTWDLQP